MKNDQKIKRYKQLIRLLEHGETMPPNTLRYGFSQAEIKVIDDSWREELKSRKIDKPAEVKKYAILLQRACYYYALMERHSSSIPKSLALSQKYAYKSDSAFESAIEYLREMAKCSDIQMWLDRSIYGDIGWDPISIPRVIGSKSAECLNKSKTPYPVTTKKMVIIQFLYEARSKLENKNLEAFMVDPAPAPIKRNRKGLDFSGFRF